MAQTVFLQSPLRIIKVCGRFFLIKTSSANLIAEDIYGHGKPFRKAQSYATMVPWEGGWTSATCIDKTMHKSLRHTVVSGMSASSLKLFEPSILKNVAIYFHELLEGPRFEEGWSQARDMNLWSMKIPTTSSEFLTKH